MKNSTKVGSGILGLLTLLGAKTIWDRFHYNTDGYNNKGYDKKGYDRKGFDRHGYDKNGYDRFGFDQFDYDKQGYDKEGYHRLNGRNREGYNRAGYNEYGYNREGFDRASHTKRYYDVFFADELQPYYNKAYIKMKQNELDYALYHTRILMEQLLKLLVRHSIGPDKLGDSILENLKICENNRLLSEEFLSKLHRVRKICNPNDHEMNAEKDFDRVYFSIMQISEFMNLVKTELNVESQPVEPN